uniref:Uncharacterized protein n=1 Tax=Arundo donax TaxID=35708 RepID=A0A0A8YCY5_ARUDO
MKIDYVASCTSISTWSQAIYSAEFSTTSQGNTN